MELSFIFYLFAAFIIIPGTYFVLSNQKKFVAAIIACIGLIVLFVLFGIQLYTVQGDYVTSPATMTWPPSINMCPDFLSLYKVSEKYYCVDTAGVSKISGELEKFNPTNAAGITTTPQSKQLFNIFADETNDETRRNNIKNECIRTGVTWEGVYDGINGYTNTIPKPS
uniref:Uncharacterized protein n=1 Tax=viral metagenome TaxID=1070528 RepID=A0A6C0IIQ4_9ZZZZ